MERGGDVIGMIVALIVTVATMAVVVMMMVTGHFEVQADERILGEIIEHDDQECLCCDRHDPRIQIIKKESHETPHSVCRLVAPQTGGTCCRIKLDFFLGISLHLHDIR